MTSQEPTDVPNADEILSTPATPGAHYLVLSPTSKTPKPQTNSFFSSKFC
jgi:hypothetical protein